MLPCNLLLIQRSTNRNRTIMAKLSVWWVDASGYCAFDGGRWWRYGWLHVQAWLRREAEGGSHRDVAAMVGLAMRRIKISGALCGGICSRSGHV